jgi:hypothetical protein
MWHAPESRMLFGNTKILLYEGKLAQAKALARLDSASEERGDKTIDKTILCPVPDQAI